jgi:hypothetical protein
VIVGAIDRSWGMRGVSVFPTAWLSRGCVTRDFRWETSDLDSVGGGPVVDVEERALRIDHESCNAQLPVQSPQEQR